MDFIQYSILTGNDPELHLSILCIISLFAYYQTHLIFLVNRLVRYSLPLKRASILRYDTFLRFYSVPGEAFILPSTTVHVLMILVGLLLRNQAWDATGTGSRFIRVFFTRIKIMRLSGKQVRLTFPFTIFFFF